MRMKIILATWFTAFVCYMSAMHLTSCGGVNVANEKAGDTDTTDTDGSTNGATATTSEPEVGTIAIGGMPTDTEAAAAAQLTNDEASSSAASIEVISGTIALDISDSGSTSLTATDDCDEGIFCLAKGFGKIFDLVTKATQCNFDHLLYDDAGNKSALRQVKDYPIYFVDGFGTVGLDDNGNQFCPTKAAVKSWAQSKGLIEGAPATAVDNEALYPPTRLVIHKNQEGTIRWQLVMFPKDFIDELAEYVDFFKTLVDKDLDFKVFEGVHTEGTEVGKGKGRIQIDWDELYRMMAMLDAADAGMPKGKIEITYNTENDIKRFTSKFLDGFTFGGDNEGPFTTGTETVVLTRENESYLRFRSAKPLVNPNATSDPGPMGIVQLCAGAPTLGQDPAKDILVHQVPVASHLATPSENHVQLIWSKDPNKPVGPPDNYLSVLTSTKGGPFIHGNSQFYMAKKAGTLSTGIRVRAPWCDNADLETNLTKWKALGFVLRDADGFRNIIFTGKIGTATAGAAVFASKEKISETFPSFKYFKPIRLDKPEEKPEVE